MNRICQVMRVRIRFDDAFLVLQMDLSLMVLIGILHIDIVAVRLAVFVAVEVVPDKSYVQ